MANIYKQKQTKKDIKLEFIVWFFIRKSYESKYKNVYIPVALKYLITNFTQKIITSNLLTINEDLQFYQLLSNKLLENEISNPLNPNINNTKSSSFKFKFLYKASDNNFTSDSFHKFCDNYSSTIIIIKSNYGNIFGGYTSIKWQSPSTMDENGNFVNLSVTLFDDKSFLFTIRDINDKSNDNENRVNYPKLHLPESVLCGSITLCRDLGPTFGQCDIQIVKKCNDNRQYFQNYTSKFSYKHNGNICGAPKKKNLSLQTNNDHKTKSPYFFTVVDYEVYQVYIDK